MATGCTSRPSPDGRTIYVNAQNGSWTRFDNVTGDMMSLRLRAPEGEEPYRWDWASPSLLSRHDPNVVYLGGNRLFISRDRGDSFTRTDDLTRQQDRDELEIMGVRGADTRLSRNDGTSSYGEIVTISESPLDPAVLWVGTDDGNVQVSSDGGRGWNEVSGGAPGLPDGAYVSRVLASADARGTAYVTFDAHRDGDFRPFVYRAEDYGARWTPLHGGLPSGSVNVIAQHPDNPDVLFAGTEHHVFASTDRGASWARFPGLPTTAYDDMVIHPREKDLVLGTHGRSIIIIDDVGPLARYAASADEPVVLYGTGPGTIMNYWKDTSYRGHSVFMGGNPVDGSVVTYRLGSGSGSASLTVRNAAGDVVRTMEVPSAPGLHRVDWDLRHALPSADESEWAAHDPSEVPRTLDRRGPFVSPGIYSLELSARGMVQSGNIRVAGDPDLPLTAEDYREREAFLLEVLELHQLLEAAGESASGPRRQLNQLYEAINGGGVRQGTLHPPTTTQREQLERIKRALRRQGLVA